MKNFLLTLFACIFSSLTIACLFLPGILVVEKATDQNTTKTTISSYSAAEIISGTLTNENNEEAVENIEKNGTKGEQIAYQMKIFGETFKISNKKTCVSFAIFLVLTCLFSVFLSIGLIFQFTQINEKLKKVFLKTSFGLSFVQIFCAFVSTIFSFYWVNGTISGESLEGNWTQIFNSFPSWGIILIFIFSTTTFLLLYELKRYKIKKIIFKRRTRK